MRSSKTPRHGEAASGARPRFAATFGRGTPDVTTRLIRLLDDWGRSKIVVAGDFMLDRYVHGNADRLAPDAPVPVLSVDRIENRPGGAANVCLDLLALHCEVACLGVVGVDHPGALRRRDDREDPAGAELRAQLAGAGCDVSGLVVDPARQTTVKFNLVGLAQHRHPQKMFRVDSERREPIAEAIEKKLLTAARRALRGAAALCLEDYHKGVLTPSLCAKLIALARDVGVPVLVDPAAIGDYRKYRGATCLTPNRTEASLATGLDAAAGDGPTLHKMARTLLRRLALEAVVLTLDKQGALLLERGGRPRLVPTVARQVYDVTGAGDMVLAVLAAARANGADWPAAVELANVAAGLEVEKFGIVPIALEEVLLSLLQRQHEGLGKLRRLDALVRELAAYRQAGQRIAFTNGCFDILHAGHVAFLREARRAGDLLVVGLNSDASIRRLKGEGRPVNREADRVMVMSELQSVDYVVVFDEDTPMRLIEAIRPEALVKGADYQRREVVGGDYVEAHGGKVVLVPLVAGRSTTNIIRRISGAVEARTETRPLLQAPDRGEERKDPADKKEHPGCGNAPLSKKA